MATKKKRPTPVRPPIACAFSAWMIAERERQGLSRYALGKNSDMGVTTLTALEVQGCEPRLSTFVLACRALGKNPSTVLRKLLDETDAA